MLLLPATVDHIQPFRGTRITIVMLVKRDAVFGRLVRPPAGDDIQREPSLRNIVDVRGLFGEQCGIVKCRPHRDHDLELFGHSRECGGGRPGIERGRFHTLDVIQV